MATLKSNTMYTIDGNTFFVDSNGQIVDASSGYIWNDERTALIGDMDYNIILENVSNIQPVGPIFIDLGHSDTIPDDYTEYTDGETYIMLDKMICPIDIDVIENVLDDNDFREYFDDNETDEVTINGYATVSVDSDFLDNNGIFDECFSTWLEKVKNGDIYDTMNYNDVLDWLGENVETVEFLITAEGLKKIDPREKAEKIYNLIIGNLTEGVEKETSISELVRMLSALE